jgi:bacteriocin biosynthesis cyclodehydratase domain-containing protein
MDDNMLILHEGRFGSAVAQRLGGAGRHDALQDFVDRLPEAGDAQARPRFIACALTHKRVSLLKALDTWCAAREVPWALCFLADKYLYCGPHIVPGNTVSAGCFHCFYKRDLTHLLAPREPSRELALDHHFDHHPGTEIPGFTAGTVHMAAAFLSQALEGGLRAGQLRCVNLIDGSMEDTMVLSTHNCPHCSRKTPQQKQEDAYRHLVTSLESLLT